MSAWTVEANIPRKPFVEDFQNHQNITPEKVRWSDWDADKAFYLYEKEKSGRSCSFTKIFCEEEGDR